MDKWLFVLRNLSSLFERPAALQERVFRNLFEAAEIAKFDRRERYEYEESLKNFRDMYSVIATAEKKGRAEGEKAKALEIAAKMKQAGMSAAEISKITGLEEAELQ